MEFKHTVKRLLQLLADGRFHSGTELAEQVGLSRAAVWKKLQALLNLGLEIHAVPGKGYCLSKRLELIDRGQIESVLSKKASKGIGRWEIHDRLTSTNSYLLSGKGFPCGTVCLAETQTAGKGRLGRTWVSPLGGNIYLSVLWYFHSSQLIAGLSLAAGAAIMRALTQAGFTRLGLKWPNDILVDGRKLGGLLVEVAGESHGPCAVVIGVGLNLYIPDEWGKIIDQAWVDAERIMGAARPSRNRLIGLILNELLPLLSDYERAGLLPYLAEWRRWNCVFGKHVTIHQGETVFFEGIARDVTDQGLLIVEDGQGERKLIASGDVRVRFE